jgi:type VI secretion system protein ImpC
MSRRFDFGEIKLAAKETSAPAHSDDTPFRIALLGDFSGRASHAQPETGIASRCAVAIDRDNFDEVLARLKPGISLEIGAAAPLTLQFSELDDFHPDRLYERAEMFRRLREVRDRLQNPDTFATAAEELGVKPGPQPPARQSAEPATTAAVVSDVLRKGPGGLLDEILEHSQDRAAEDRPSRAPDELQKFVRRVTEPHLVAAADPRQAELLSVIDRALSAQMRALLHVPAFQALEAAWRAVFFLVRRIETSSQLKLYLIDVSKEQLAADLMSSPDLRASGAYRLLVEKSVGTPGAEPWAVIVGNYTFGAERQDAELLARLAKIAKAAGAPFIAAASPRLLGCASLADTPDPRDWKLTPDPNDAAAWTALRGLPEATAIGLALPRFLLRLPYGKKTDPIEAFDFEEMPEAPPHEDYLWGNPAFACALLLAQSFSEYGWEMRPGTHAEIDGLPLHVYQRDGESEPKPCAEALLTEQAAERILEQGLMPLVTLKGRDAVRLLTFQSVASRCPH